MQPWSAGRCRLPASPFLQAVFRNLTAAMGVLLISSRAGLTLLNWNARKATKQLRARKRGPLVQTSKYSQLARRVAGGMRQNRPAPEPKVRTNGRTVTWENDVSQRVEDWKSMWQHSHRKARCASGNKIYVCTPFLRPQGCAWPAYALTFQLPLHL